MPKVFLNQGGSRIEMSFDHEKAFRGALSDAETVLVDQLGGTVEKLWSDARERWPVGREGANPFHSRDGLERGVEVDPARGEVRASLWNRAKWWVYVKSFQNGLGGKSAFLELGRKPARDAVRPLLIRVSEQTRAALQAKVGKE